MVPGNRCREQLQRPAREHGPGQGMAWTGPSPPGGQVLLPGWGELAQVMPQPCPVAKAARAKAPRELLGALGCPSEVILEEVTGPGLVKRMGEVGHHSPPRWAIYATTAEP